MEIKASPTAGGSAGRKKEDSTHFQAITCYVWFLPDAIPSWQSPKTKQFLGHPFYLTKLETSEGSVPWCLVIETDSSTW